MVPFGKGDYTLEILTRNLVPIGLGILGSVVQFMRSKDTSFKRFSIQLLSAVFVGALMSLAVEDLKLPEASKYILVALAGTLNVVVLDVISDFFLKRLRGHLRGGRHDE